MPTAEGALVPYWPRMAQSAADVFGARAPPPVPPTQDGGWVQLIDLHRAMPDDEAFHRAAGIGHTMWAVSHGLLTVPVAHRRAVLDGMRPLLEARGLSARQIDQFDPTDENLEKLKAGVQPLLDLHKSLHPDVFSARDETPAPGGQTTQFNLT